VRDDAARGEAVSIILGETERLERMVEDVMDLARLGSGAFTLDVASVDLAEALAPVIARARRGDVAVQADLARDVRIETDAGRVQQIVTNLVQNAMRVTPRIGRIVVSAGTSGTGAVISVSDTGPGIAREDLPHVFERSYLWNASRGKQAVGTGLGLAIVRELVTALDGRVTVDSTPGKGTTFRVELPARPRART
ncbi:MAG: HAMP domain-containing histidine kinase, partial [Actinobacteria bacterium]|nr:HAMP domain-containing histidine kinase [Actinomycetota bacterium]